MSHHSAAVPPKLVTRHSNHPTRPAHCQTLQAAIQTTPDSYQANKHAWCCQGRPRQQDMQQEHFNKFSKIACNVMQFGTAFSVRKLPILGMMAAVNNIMTCHCRKYAAWGMMVRHRQVQPTRTHRIPSDAHATTLPACCMFNPKSQP